MTRADPVSQQTRIRIYFLFGFIPVWAWEEKTSVYKDPKWAASERVTQ